MACLALSLQLANDPDVLLQTREWFPPARTLVSLSAFRHARRALSSSYGRTPPPSSSAAVGDEVAAMVALVVAEEQKDQQQHAEEEAPIEKDPFAASEAVNKPLEEVLVGGFKKRKDRFGVSDPTVALVGLDVTTLPPAAAAKSTFIGWKALKISQEHKFLRNRNF